MIKKLTILLLSILLITQLVAITPLAYAGDEEEDEDWTAEEMEEYMDTMRDLQDDELPDEITEAIDNSSGLNPDDDDTDADADADADAEEEEEEEEDEGTTMPSIPKPDTLIGPDAGSDQATVQEYFREKAIPRFISGFIGIVGLLAFISLLIAGIQFLTAYGNDEKVATAKRTAQYAIAGFVIAILSYAIVSIVGSVSLDSVLSIPTADAVTVDDLLPSEEELIESSPNAQGASLPSGDLVETVVPKAINIILYVTSSVILVALVYAGILLVIGRGKEEDISKAKDIILYAITGIIIIGVSYAIIYGIARLNL